MAGREGSRNPRRSMVPFQTSSSLRPGPCCGQDRGVAGRSLEEKPRQFYTAPGYTRDQGPSQELQDCFELQRVAPSPVPSSHSLGTGKGCWPSPPLRASSPVAPTCLFFPPLASLASDNSLAYFPFLSPHSKHTDLLVVAPTCLESSCLRTLALLRMLFPQQAVQLAPSLP